MLEMPTSRFGSELLVSGSGFCKLPEVPNIAKMDNGADWSLDPHLDGGDEESFLSEVTM